MFLGSCISSRHKGWVWEGFGSVGIFFSVLGFLCENSTKCCPFFCLAFSRLWCLPILKVLLFLGVVRRGFLFALVPNGRFWRNVLGSAVFWGFLNGSFSYVLVCAGFCVRKFDLLVLGFSRNCLAENAPETFFSDKPGFFGHLQSGHLNHRGSLLSCFFGRVPSP